MKKWKCIILLSALLSILIGCMTGCGLSGDKEENYDEVDYTVVKVGEIPDEVNALIADQGDKAFQMVYKSDGWLYIMRGYGKQKTGGYSIRILNVGISDESLHVKSELLGPQTKEDQKGDGSKPYFVLKLEDPGYPVMFEESGGETNGNNQEESASDLQEK